MSGTQYSSPSSVNDAMREIRRLRGHHRLVRTTIFPTVGRRCDGGNTPTQRPNRLVQWATLGAPGPQESRFTWPSSPPGPPKWPKVAPIGLPWGLRPIGPFVMLGAPASIPSLPCPGLPWSTDAEVSTFGEALQPNVCLQRH